MRDLDDLDPGAVEGGHDRAHLRLGEPVPHGVRPVPEGRVGDPHVPALVRAAVRARAAARVHAVTLAIASSSPTRAAAAVMMSRFPAQSGR